MTFIISFNRSNRIGSKKLFFCLVFSLSFLLHFSQNNNNIPKDTTLKSNKKDSVKTVKVIRDTLPETGVAVSPSTLRFNVRPGTLQTKVIKINNDTKHKYFFQISFQDYGPPDNGESDVPVNKYSAFALSKYIIVTPTLIEVGPRQTKSVTVTVDIPAGDSMNVSMWTTLIIDELVDREKLELPNISQSGVGMGISNSFGFGVNVFQNPPNVTINDVEITSMSFLKSNGNSLPKVLMEAKNKGTGIGYCLYYLELTNLVTGKHVKMKVKQFSIFPGYVKHFSFDLPSDLEKGPYSALAVLDFGNKEELQTAELEFNIE